MVGKISVFVYGVMGYLLFNVVLLYFIGFVGNFVVPKTIDSGVEVPIIQGMIINLILIGLFGFQHSIMARPAFKQKWLTIIPVQIERTTYVFLSGIALILLCWLWQPLPTVIWQVEQPVGYWVLLGLFWLGWLFSLYATFLINHFDLVGLRQVYLYLRNIPYTPVDFKAVSVYKYIRHPIMLGTIMGLWATPTMTVGHLMLAVGLTTYIFIGIRCEERDLLNTYGEFYEKYRQKTSMVMPIRLYR